MSKNAVVWTKDNKRHYEILPSFKEAYAFGQSKMKEQGVSKVFVTDPEIAKDIEHRHPFWQPGSGY